MEAIFIEEVVRVAQDSVYWVRKEASFALGALAKVVSQSYVNETLVRGRVIHRNSSFQPSL